MAKQAEKIKDEMREDILQDMRAEVQEDMPLFRETIALTVILFALWLFLSPFKLGVVNDLISILWLSFIVNFLLLSVAEVLFHLRWKDAYNPNWGKIKIFVFLAIVLLAAGISLVKWQNNQNFNFELSIALGFLEYEILKRKSSSST